MLVEKSVWIPAKTMTPTTSLGCNPLATIEDSGGNLDLQTMDYPAGAYKRAQVAISFAQNWDRYRIKVAFYWSHADALDGPFDVVWGVESRGFSDDDSMNVPPGGTVLVGDTGGTVDDLYITHQIDTHIPQGALQANDMVIFHFSRLGNHEKDKMEIDARLHGVKIFYNVEV